MSREMKESGIEWIGQIPMSWNKIKVKNAFIRKKGRPTTENYNILSLARSGIKIRDISTGEGQIASDYSQYNPVVPGDILLNPMDLVSGDNSNISEVEGVISQAYFNLKAKNGYNPYFYNYYFKLQYWLGAFFSHGKGVSFKNRWTLNNETVSNFPILVPSLDEQTKIANFLDKKISEINKLSEQTKQSIEEFKAYKQSLITETVTRGLNPDVPMIDSGIEWIGEFPVDWIITKLKFLTTEPLQYGANESGDIYKGNDIRYIRITDIDENNKLKEDGKLSLSYEKAKKYLLKDGDILLARSGASVGKSFLYLDKYGPSTFAGYLIKATLKENINSKFIFYNTLSYSYENWKNSNFIQSTIQNLSAEKYNNYHLVIPGDINEQNEIVEFLDNRTQQINHLITKKQQMLEELESYKQSLIYEYVTGKKEVK